MDGFGLTASIIQSIASLAWPAAIFGSVWLFRDKIIELLPQLRIKYKEWEATFQRLEDAEEEAKKLPSVAATDTTIPTPAEKAKFEKVASISPAAAILEARRDLEEAVRSLASANGMTSSKSQPLGSITRTLWARNLIDPTTSALLDDLRVIGNNAAHGESTAFSYEDALKYRALTDRAISALAARSARAG